MLDRHVPSRSLRRGSAMTLVIVAVAIAVVISLTFLSTSTTTTSIAQTMNHHAQARQIAECGVRVAIAYIEQAPDWRSARPSGMWFTSTSLFGGTLEVAGEFDAAPVTTPVTLINPSFEEQLGSLALPLLNPPMSGSIGGWDIERTAAIETGATVPHVGIIASPAATDGNRVAHITFNLSVQGTASITQSLPDSLAPNTNYALTCDVTKTLPSALLADVELRVFAGATLIVSSKSPSVFTAFNESGDSSVLFTIDLNPTTQQFILRFTTDDSPPPGSLRIELGAASQIGVISQVVFDNVQLNVEVYSPVTLTAVGKFGQASHRVTAVVAQPFPARRTSTLRWSEP